MTRQSEALEAVVTRTPATPEIRKKFLNRLKEGNLIRKKNPLSHFCIYFAVYEPASRKVFLGHHKKSGLWLFNGGHMEEKELPREAVMREIHEELGLSIRDNVSEPELLTLTKIEHPERQICQWHWDIWYFIRITQSLFHPESAKLEKEFFESRWSSIKEALTLVRDQSTRRALKFLVKEWKKS